MYSLGVQAMFAVIDPLTKRAMFIESKNYFPHIGCIFIHVPRTGGTSVSNLLARVDTYLKNKGVNPRFSVPRRLHDKHTKGLAYAETLERDIWENSFKFCAVRNPFDLVVSHYNWWLQKASRFPMFQKQAELVSELGSF